MKEKITIELTPEAAELIRKALEHRPLPPLDRDELAQNELYNALADATGYDPDEEDTAIIAVEMEKGLAKRIVLDPHNMDWRDKEELIQALEDALEVDDA